MTTSHVESVVYLF